MTVKITDYMKKYRLYYLRGFVGMFFYVGMDLLSPMVIQRLIDDVVVAGQLALLMPLLFGLLGIGLGRAVFGYMEEFTFDWIGMTSTNQMRKDVFDHVQTLSVDFFQKHNTGELMTRLKDDVDKVCVGIGFVGMLAVEAVFHTVLVVVCMLRLSPALTLVPLLLLPLIGFLAVRMERKLGKVYDEISDETAALNTVAEENLAGVRTVKAFAREEFELKKFRGHNRRFYELNMRQARMAGTYQPVISFIGKVLLLAVVIVGGLLVIRGEMTLGTLGAFSEYANSMIWLSNDLASAFASWKKIRRIMAQEPAIQDEEHVKALKKVEGRLTFEHVGLSLDGKKILEDISFDLQPGKTLGIMGMTGAGKSMLVNLAERFYDPTEGKILLDGTDLRSLPLKQVRSSMAVVHQDVFLFSDTVRQNVRMGQKKIMKEQVVPWALKKAGALGFVSALARREETLIGERGVGLSGGQKQRISIARAMAKKAPILILDDSTSALDMEMERQIQRDLKDMEGMSKIIIAHRVSAVRSADEILILRDGRIDERGTHKELMRQKGEYYRTWCAQYGEEVKACP